MQNVLDNIYALFQRPASKYKPVYIDQAQACTDPPTGTVAVAERHYFRIWIQEMYLKDDVQWFQQWYPILNCNLAFRAGGNDVKSGYLHNPPQIDSKNVTQGWKLAKGKEPLVPLSPYRGDTIAYTIGLFKIGGDNYMRSAIKLLSDVASLAVQPQVTAAISLANPIVESISNLVQATKGGLELAVVDSFSDGDLRDTYLAAILDNQTPNQNFFVKENRLCVGSSLDQAVPVSGYSYVLLKIEVVDGRTDWASFETIQKPFREALAKQAQGRTDEAKELFNTAIYNCYMCTSFTNLDINRIAKLMREQFNSLDGSQGISEEGYISDLTQLYESDRPDVGAKKIPLSQLVVN